MRRSRQQILFPQVEELMQTSTYFPRSEKNVALWCSFNFKHFFWPTSTLLRGHLALATLCPLDTDPQILARILA